MKNRITNLYHRIITPDTGKFTFAINLPPVMNWLFVLPIAILSYVVVKFILLLVMFILISIIPGITPDAAFWIGFVLGSMIGQVIGTFAFCFFGSAMAPKNNNRVCLILGLLFGLFFMIPIFFGYITFIFIAPYLCCIVGIVLAILYRKRRYVESLNSSF